MKRQTVRCLSDDFTENGVIFSTNYLMVLKLVDRNVIVQKEFSFYKMNTRNTICPHAIPTKVHKKCLGDVDIIWLMKLLHDILE